MCDVLGSRLEPVNLYCSVCLMYLCEFLPRGCCCGVSSRLGMFPNLGRILFWVVSHTGYLTSIYQPHVNILVCGQADVWAVYVS